MPLLLVRGCVSATSEAPSAQLLLPSSCSVLWSGSSLMVCRTVVLEMDNSWLTVWQHGVTGCQVLLEMLSHVYPMWCIGITSF